MRTPFAASVAQARRRRTQGGHSHLKVLAVGKAPCRWRPRPQQDDEVTQPGATEAAAVQQGASHGVAERTRREPDERPCRRRRTTRSAARPRPRPSAGGRPGWRPRASPPPEHTGHEEAEGGEGEGSQGTTASRTPRTPPRPGPSQRTNPTTEITADLQHLDQQEAADLAGEQPGPRERRGPEALDHPVPTLEPGRDRQRRERRRHHREREDAGSQDVDRAMGQTQADVLGAGARRRSARSPGSPRRATAPRRSQHQPRLHRGLREHLPGERRSTRPRGDRSQVHDRHLASGELEEDVLEVPLAQRQ